MVKRILAIMITIAVLLLSTSCGEQTENPNINANTNQSTAVGATQTGVGNPAPTPVSRSADTLTINVRSYDRYVQRTIDQFNDSGAGCTIKPKFFSLDITGDYEKKLEYDLVSGAGPDIIVEDIYSLPHLIKLMQSGVFADLSEYIDTDEEFNKEDYIEEVLDFGIMNGYRYFIPLSYYVNGILFTTREIIEERQFSFDDRYITIPELAQLAGDFEEKHGEGVDLLSDFRLPNYYVRVGPSSKYVSVDTENLANCLELYRDIQVSAHIKPGQTITYSSSLLPDNKVAFNYSSLYGFDPMESWEYNGFSYEVIPELYAMTDLEGNRVMNAEPYYLVAVNANCANKKAAYQFIKLLLSANLQRRIRWGLPINKEAYRIQKEAYIEHPQHSVAEPPEEGPNRITNGNGITEGETAAYITAQMEEIIDCGLACNFIDQTISDIFREAENDVYNGVKTPEEAVVDIRDKIISYLDSDVSEYIKPPEASPPDAPSVTIWFLDTSTDAMNAVKAFNEDRKDVRIEETVYSSSSREEFVNKLTTSIMSGEGPDIIHYDRHVFNSLRKTASTGVFCDLDELIAKDPTFKSLDLNYRVLEAGVFNGKRYVIPLRYELPLLMSTKGILNQNGIDIDESNWTMPKFREMVLDYAGRTGNDYFINYLFMFKYLVGGCGVDFIDHETKTANFETKEFIDLMKYYKEIYPHITPVEIDMSYDLPERMIQNNTIAMYFDFINSPERLWSYNATYHGVLGEEPVLYPVPTIGGSNDIPVSFTHAVSINQKCAKKQAALDFIEVLLSEDIQGAVDRRGNSNATLGFPVNNKALQNEIQKYMDPSVPETVFSNGMVPVPLSEGFAARITELADRTRAGPEIDLEVYRIISEGMKSYLEGKQTAEQVAKEINNKVNLFLNE